MTGINIFNITTNCHYLLTQRTKACSQKTRMICTPLFLNRCTVKHIVQKHYKHYILQDTCKHHVSGMDLKQN
jgi:hypothetical protein